MPNLNNIWNDFFNLMSEYNCCLLKNLNENDDKDIYVAKICNPDLINNFAKNQQTENTDTIYIDPNNKLFMAYIPKTSKIFTNLFCCNITMEQIHSKFSNYGLAIEGCFNIEPISMLPTFYRGNEFDTEYLLTVNGKTGRNKSKSNSKSFLVIDNHNIIKIMDDLELKNYKPVGVNVQYIEGLRLYNNKIPFMSFASMKDLKTKDISNIPENVNGSNVIIDYQQLKIKINDKSFDFSEIGKRIQFNNNQLFNTNNGLFVFAIDENDNIFLIYHQHIDIFNMMLLLQLFNCKDAIVLCNSSDANIIWKENGQNIYNKTDFLGNPKKIISNVITFSG